MNYLKQPIYRSKTYRMHVAAMDCMHCGIGRYSQAAHADFGKGGAIKADDRTCFPLCCTRPGITGCHHDIGTARIYPREVRRMLEIKYAEETRRRMKQAGLWPASWRTDE